MLESATLDNSVPVQGIAPRVDRRSNTPEGKIARVVYRLLADHSIERTFGDEDDLRDVGLTSLDMAKSRVVGRSGIRSPDPGTRHHAGKFPDRGDDY